MSERIKLTENYVINSDILDSLDGKTTEGIKDAIVGNIPSETVKFNKNLMQFSVNVYKNDLILIKYLLKNIGSGSKSDVLRELLEKHIHDGFNELDSYSQRDAAILTDELITRDGYEHAYNGKTWFWELANLDWINHICDPDWTGQSSLNQALKSLSAESE